MNVRGHSRGHPRGRSRGSFRGPTRGHTRGPTRGVKFRGSRALCLSGAPCLLKFLRNSVKNLLMPLFLMGCFPGDFQEVKRPLRTQSVKRPIKVGKRPINEAKRPIKAKVLVGVSVGCLMGCFRAPQPWRKTAPP